MRPRCVNPREMQRFFGVERRIPCQRLDQRALRIMLGTATMHLRASWRLVTMHALTLQCHSDYTLHIMDPIGLPHCQLVSMQSSLMSCTT